MLLALGIMILMNEIKETGGIAVQLSSYSSSRFIQGPGKGKRYLDNIVVERSGLQ
jgi:hypothetical protein